MIYNNNNRTSPISTWYERYAPVILIVWAFALCIGCNQNKERDNFMRALISLDNSQYAHQEIDPGLAEEINGIVSLFENDLKEETASFEELGVLYKRLGTQYLALAELYSEIETNLFPEYPVFTSPRQEEIYNKMRGIRYYDDKVFLKAHESFMRAIEFDPGNPLLYYYAGVCAGWIGKSSVGVNRESEQKKWFNAAEASYIRALELDPLYSDALYGYAVLLVIELGRETEGIVYIHKLLEKEKKHINGLFLLARAYYQLNDLEQALDEYDRILSISSSGEIRDRAAQLKEQVKDELYESQ